MNDDDDVATVVAVVADVGCYSVAVVVVVEETSSVSDMNSSPLLVSAGLSVAAAAAFCEPLSCGRSLHAWRTIYLSCEASVEERASVRMAMTSDDGGDGEKTVYWMMKIAILVVHSMAMATTSVAFLASVGTALFN